MQLKSTTKNGVTIYSHRKDKDIYILARKARKGLYELIEVYSSIRKAENGLERCVRNTEGCELPPETFEVLSPLPNGDWISIRSKTSAAILSS